MIKSLVLFFCLISINAWSGQIPNPWNGGKPDLVPTITEEDASPRLETCRVYKFTNGSVTDNLDGTCSMAGGSSYTNADAQSATGWTDGGTNVYLTTSSDNVGIGTTGASVKLHVYGSTATAQAVLQTSDSSETVNILQVKDPTGTAIAGITPLGRFLANSGSATRPGYGFLGYTTTGFYNVGGTDVRFEVGGTDVFRLTAGSSPGFQLASGGDVTWSSGVVGSSSDTGLSRFGAGVVQVTDGNIASPTAANLAVLDDAYAAGWNGSNNVPTKNAVYDKIETISAGAGQWQTTAVGIGTTGLVGIGTYSPSGMLEVVKVGTNAPLMVSSAVTGDGDYLIVSSVGNVGIGTFFPDDLLEIRRANVANNTGGLLISNSSASGWVGGVSWEGTSGGNTYNMGRISADNGAMYFYTPNSSRVLTLRQELEAVNGGANFYATGGSVVDIYGATESPYSMRIFNQTFSPTVPVFEYYGYNSGTFASGTSSAEDWQFYTNGLANTRMTITSGGNVGVGATAPESLFEVQGTEGNDATITLDSDDGDDTVDTWKIESDADTNDLIFNNDTSPLVTFQDGGNVGIGTVTTFNRLNVANPNSVYTNDDTWAIKTGTTAAKGLSLGYDKDRNVGLIAASDRTQWLNTAINPVPGTGNLGIGTFNPKQLLDVYRDNGSVFYVHQGSSTNYTSMRLGNDQNTLNRSMEFNLAGSAYATQILPPGPSGESGALYMDSNFPLQIGTNALGRMIIEGGGNIGLGTMFPSTLLEVGSRKFNVQSGGNVGIGTTTPAGGLVVMNGNVGIGTVSPKSKLQLDNSFSYKSIYDNGTTGGTVNIDWNNGNKQIVTVSSNITFTFTDPGGPCALILFVKENGTGGHTKAYPASVKWPANQTTPSWIGTANHRDMVIFQFDGTYYFGGVNNDYNI